MENRRHYNQGLSSKNTPPCPQLQQRPSKIESSSSLSVEIDSSATADNIQIPNSARTTTTGEIQIPKGVLKNTQEEAKMEIQFLVKLGDIGATRDMTTLREENKALFKAMQALRERNEYLEESKKKKELRAFQKGSARKRIKESQHITALKKLVSEKDQVLRGHKEKYKLKIEPLELKNHILERKHKALEEELEVLKKKNTQETQRLEMKNRILEVELDFRKRTYNEPIIKKHEL
jgi:hypothetical protein